MITRTELSQWRHVLPFGLSFVTLPLIWIGVTQGGWTTWLLPIYGWWVFPFLDWALGSSREGADVNTPDSELFWYRAITVIWFPLQFVVIFGGLWAVSGATSLGLGEKLTLFLGVGVISGSVGFVYAHELMHQSSRLERWLADLLLATVMYSHFRSEHLLVHHIHVCTPRDAVTARYNEGFHRFFFRVLPQCLLSALRAEGDRLEKNGKSRWDKSNPFWRFWTLQAAFMALALAIGGIAGLGLFLFQAFVAIFQLELINYIEHYGLTRKRLDEGRFEPVRPRHSWNADFRATNWYLINLQRHSDHHYKPARRFPLLQSYAPEEAPILPAGYPVMTLLALVPPLFRRVMNPRVRAWRRQFYPEITDWKGLWA
jgi:alkane 1-monooxygenase